MRNDDAEHVILRSTALFELLAPHRRIEVRVELSYDTRDPFAVTTAFHAGRNGWVRWVFARDLLADGLLTESGDGDVRIRPGIDNPEVLTIELNSPSGHAVFEASTQRILEFLDNTYDVVVPGHETRWAGAADAVHQLICNDRA